jgi:hypothetical protein
MAQPVIETITVEFKATEKGKKRVLSANPIVPIAELLERYRSSVESFKEMGYTIVSEDLNRHSFVAKKEYIED